METAAITFPGLYLVEDADEKFREMTSYLSSEKGYWKNNDIWELHNEAFIKAGIRVPEQKRTSAKGYTVADLSGYKPYKVKTEIKYFLLYSMKEGLLTAISICKNYTRAIRNLGKCIPAETESLEGVDEHIYEGMLPELSENEAACLKRFAGDLKRFVTDFYDTRHETEKDVWHALKIQGVRISAAAKRGKPSMNFTEIPEHYRPIIKRFMKRLVIKRSWSYCTELLVYIRYFFRTFYEHGYTDGFLEDLDRKDMEGYFGWVAADYADKNATFRSKAVSFIRTFLDYIQLSEYPGVPKKDVDKLIFDDDIPKRERPEDTMAKVKYVPRPVRDQIDASVNEIDPPEMIPVYVLLRETGWRGTDVLDLRYDSCLDYVWNDKEQSYVPYLCGEITKTGIPMLKIPLRDEVGEMVKGLIKTAHEKST